VLEDLILDLTAFILLYEWVYRRIVGPVYDNEKENWTYMELLKNPP
jgi:hypothetical protein